jgi:hypothetical protein
MGPESEDDNTRLEQATLIVSRAREQVARQRAIIAELETMGLDHSQWPETAASGGVRRRIMSDAFSAIMITQALIWAETRSGIADASTTRSPSMPRTRISGSSTAAGVVPIWRRCSADDQHLMEARVSGDNLEWPTLIRGERPRRDSVLGAWRQSPYHNFCLGSFQVRKRRDIGPPAHSQCPDRAAGPADIGEFGDVVADNALRHHIAQKKPAAPRHREREPVWDGLVEEIAEEHAALLL